MVEKIQGDEFMIPRENYNELARINKIQEEEVQRLRKEVRELKEKIEMLKKFYFIGEIINETRNVFNQR